MLALRKPPKNTPIAEADRLPSADVLPSADRLPSLRLQDHSERLADIHRKRAALLRQDEELVAEINELHAKLMKAAASRAALSAAATRLLESDATDFPSIDEQDSISGRIGKLQEKRSIIREAVRMLEGELVDAETEASARIVSILMPTMRQKTLAIARALDRLVRANEDFERICDALYAAQVRFGRLQNVGAGPLLGRAYDCQSPACRWFFDAVERGMLHEEAIPDWVKEAKPC